MQNVCPCLLASGLHTMLELHCLGSLQLGERKQDGSNFLSLVVCKPELFFQVEIWLNHVLRHMKATVRHEMTEAVTAYEEKSREQWLFDYPAQVFSQLDHPGPILVCLSPPPVCVGLLRLKGLKLTAPVFLHRKGCGA